MRDDLDIDPRLVHLLETKLAEVIQPATDLQRATFWTVKSRRQFGVVIVLFECDDERLPLRCHVCSSTYRDVTPLLTLGSRLCTMCSPSLARPIPRTFVLPHHGL